MKWLKHLYQKLLYAKLHRPVSLTDAQQQLQKPENKIKQYLINQTPPDKKLEQLTQQMDKVAKLYNIPIIYFPDGSHTFMNLSNVRQLKRKKHRTN